MGKNLVTRDTFHGMEDLWAYMLRDGDIHRNLWKPAVKRLLVARTGGGYSPAYAAQVLEGMVEMSAKKYAILLEVDFMRCFPRGERLRLVERLVARFENEYPGGVSSS